MSTRNRMALIGLAITMAACGGGGREAVVGSFPGSPPPPPPTNVGGVWEGSMFNNNSGLTFEAIGVAVENSRDGRLANDQGLQFRLGSISGSAGDVSAGVTAMAPPGTAFMDGSTTTFGQLTGTVVEHTSFDGEWSLNSGETGTITMSYNALYERGSDLARTVGSWMDSFGVVYNIDATGIVFAQDAFGCVYDGAVEILYASYNAYAVTLTVSNCPGTNGTYFGRGVLADEVGTDDAFVILLDNNGQISMTYVLLKL